jgi:hypothetical protein
MGFWDPSGNKTVGVSLWGHQVRGDAPNLRTVAGAPSRKFVQRSLREMFAAAYKKFGELCRTIDEPGVAIVAVDESSGRPQGFVRLTARVDRHVAAITGRHDRADLYLNADERMSLRQLAVVMDPVQSWERGEACVKYRVLDLRTSAGFTDEQERGLRGLRCEGPALLRCGGHALFILPLGDPTDWPASPDDAWACLPERVYFDELARSPEGSFTKHPQLVQHMRRSMLVRTGGPHDTSRSLASGTPLVGCGHAAGILELEGPRVTGTLEIGHEELRDGVLLGRYERCASAPLADDPSLSRVHALLIQIDDRLLIVDTASTHGTRLIGGHRSRVLEVADGTELLLGRATRVRWRYVS